MVLKSDAELMCDVRTRTRARSVVQGKRRMTGQGDQGVNSDSDSADSFLPTHPERRACASRGSQSDGGRGRQATWASDGGGAETVAGSLLSIHQDQR